MAAADYFQEQARACRAAAADLGPSRDKEGLLFLATHYDREAKRAAAEARDAAGGRVSAGPVNSSPA